MVVPPAPPASGTLFLWPGLQPDGVNFEPIDNGVLQPVLTWGPSCAPGKQPRTYSTWWISGQYVNTNGQVSGYTGCAGGTFMSVNVCDTLDIDMVLSGTNWIQTITVAFYFFTRCFGNTGVFILKGLLIYGIFVMVSKTIRLRNAKLAPSALFFAFLGYATFPGLASLVRSQMFTYLSFITWIYALERIRMKDRRMFLVFPCTMLFWVNMHGGFVSGVGLVLLYALGELLNRKSPLPYLGIAASLVPVMFLNPYGFALLRSVVEGALMPRPFIPEWHPISLDGPMQSLGSFHVHYLAGYMILVGLTAVAAFRSLLLKQREDWTKIVVLVTTFLLGVRHRRHVVFFTLATAALAHEPMVGLLQPIRRLLDRKAPSKAERIWTVAGVALGYGLPALVLLLVIPKLHYRIGVDYRRAPVGSFEFIRQNQLTGNLATAFDFGSYAEWKLYPQCKVLIDGRYEEVFPNDVFEQAIQLSVRQGPWWEVVNRFPTDIVVLPKQGYSLADLSSLRGWKPVYQDHVSVVLLPVDKIQGPYLRPDYKSSAYAVEDLSKPIIVASQ
jgi:hypothetical protein